MKFNGMFKEFNSTYQVEAQDITDSEMMKHTLELIQDELIEFGDEIPLPSNTPLSSNFYKELVDMGYITMQQLDAYGVDIDLLLGLCMEDTSIDPNTSVIDDYNMLNYIYTRTKPLAINAPCMGISALSHLLIYILAITKKYGDIEEMYNEVHKSNMSKLVPLNQADKEVSLARERYPDALIRPVTDTHVVISCHKTGKVIKPTCYTPADMSRFVN